MEFPSYLSDTTPMMKTSRRGRPPNDARRWPPTGQKEAGTAARSSKRRQPADSSQQPNKQLREDEPLSRPVKQKNLQRHQQQFSTADTVVPLKSDADVLYGVPLTSTQPQTQVQTHYSAHPLEQHYTRQPQQQLLHFHGGGTFAASGGPPPPTGSYLLVNAPPLPPGAHYVTSQRISSSLTLNVGAPAVEDASDAPATSGYVVAELANYGAPASWTFVEEPSSGYCHALAEAPARRLTSPTRPVDGPPRPAAVSTVQNRRKQRLMTSPDGSVSSIHTHYSSGHETPPPPQQPVAGSDVYGSGGPSQQAQHSPTISVDDDTPMAAVYDSGAASGDASAYAQAAGHAARTPPETLEWLRNNYEPYEGASLPRCALYDHYIGHCRESGLEPVNAASFGKLIRSVFQGLRTRRLGTRGNSKYHYNGIRIKESSPLLRIVSPDEDYERGGGGGAVRQSFRRRSATTPYQLPHHMAGNSNAENSPDAAPSGYQLRPRVASFSTNYGDNSMTSNDSITSAEYVANGDTFDYDPQHLTQSKQRADCYGAPRSVGAAVPSRGWRAESPPGSAPAAPSGGSEATISQRRASNASAPTATVAEPEMALGSGQLPSVPAPNLDELEECLLPLGYTVPHVLKFMDAYAANCAKSLDAIKHLRFDAIEGIWTSFWQSGEQASATDEELSESVAINVDQLLIYRLSALPQVQKYMEQMDVALYQVFVEVLIPDVLRSTLTPRLSCQIRNFAKNVESWLRKAMGGAPSEAKKRRAAAVRFLANALTRYTSFNHLADAARAVLRNHEQVAQMYNDFCKVDFAIVHGQADWVCDCDPALVSSIEGEFRENLKRHHNLDEWTEWMEAVVDQVLAKYHDKPLTVQLAASKQFLLKWSFYSSMILRDVTYRSAQSFGSFHLIRLLYDEYMCLLVEMRLARITNQPIICVMRPGSQLQNATVMNYDQLQYDSLIGGGMLLHHTSDSRGNPQLAGYYGSMPNGGTAPQNGSMMMTATPTSSTATTTMFLLNGAGGPSGRYEAIPQIVYSSVLPYHHSAQATTASAAAAATVGTTACESLGTAYTLGIDSMAPCTSTPTVVPATPYAYASDAAVGGVGPELSELLIQDPSLASVDYGHPLSQQQRCQVQSAAQSQAQPQTSASIPSPHHYVMLQAGSDSAVSSGSAVTSGAVDYDHSPYAMSRHPHHQIGGIMYMDDEEMIGSVRQPQQRQQLCGREQQLSSQENQYQRQQQQQHLPQHHQQQQQQQQAPQIEKDTVQQQQQLAQCQQNGRTAKGKMASEEDSSDKSNVQPSAN